MGLEFSVWTLSLKILWNFSQKRSDTITGNIIWKMNLCVKSYLAEFEWDKFKSDGVSCGALQKILTTFMLYKCKLLFQSILLYCAAPVATTVLSVL